MKKEYKFDAKSGTMKPVEDEWDIDTMAAPKAPQKPNVTRRTSGVFKKPIPQAKPVQQAPPVQQPAQIVRLKRSQTITPVQLVNDQGLPEAYLTTVNTGILMFREGKDYDIYQIADERSKKVLAYIGGYALEMCFNMQELNTMEKIEQCLEGIKKLFRHKIMSQVLPSKDPEQK